MKRKFSFYVIIVKILVLTFFFIPKSFSEDLGGDVCENFRQELLQNNSKYQLSFYPSPDSTLNLGFEVNVIWNKNKNRYVVDRSKENYLIVGRITRQSAIGMVTPGDEIISINGLLTNSEKFIERPAIILSIMREDYNEKKETKFLLRDKEGEVYTFSDIPTEHLQNENIIAINIGSITDINEKKSEFSAVLNKSLKFRYQPGDGIQRVALNELVTDDGLYINCSFSELEWKEVNNLDPDQDIRYYNLIDFDKNKNEKKYKPIILNDTEGKITKNSQVEFQAQEKGIYTFANEFNLMSFPFDKQVLRITVYNSDAMLDETIIMPGEYNLKLLNDFAKKGNISPGWKIKDVAVLDDYSLDPTTGSAYSALHIDIHVEREVGYYLFKIIFPIILILMVCWSVSWINPRELESRLTITVVCLLSLIAYNFVIDSELPKLNYLTVLDMIILTSYIFATIPNFLSIAVFRLQKTNPSLCLLVEEKSKKYGALSYILIILFIILININLSPNHTGALFSWAVL